MKRWRLLIIAMSAVAALTLGLGAPPAAAPVTLQAMLAQMGGPGS